MAGYEVFPPCSKNRLFFKPTLEMSQNHSDFICTQLQMKVLLPIMSLSTFQMFQAFWDILVLLPRCHIWYVVPPPPSYPTGQSPTYTQSGSIDESYCIRALFCTCMQEPVFSDTWSLSVISPHDSGSLGRLLGYIELLRSFVHHHQPARRDPFDQAFRPQPLDFN